MTPSAKGADGARALETQFYRMDDGVKLVADVLGAPGAPAVVLLHGGGQTRHSWTGAATHLAGLGYRVMNFDARGHGDSDWSVDADYSEQRRGQDLLAILGEVGAPVALVGASMGGMTCIDALSRKTQAPVRALALVDIVPNPTREGVARILTFMRGNAEGFANLDEAATAVAAYNPARRRPRDATGLLKNLRRRGDRYYWHWDPRMLDFLPKTGEATDGRALLRKCRDIQIPTILVRGLMSDVVSQDGVEELQRALPHLEIFEVSGAGHMVAGDQNDAFNEGILGFLRRHHPPLS